MSSWLNSRGKGAAGNAGAPGIDGGDLPSSEDCPSPSHPRRRPGRGWDHTGGQPPSSSGLQEEPVSWPDSGRYRASAAASDRACVRPLSLPKMSSGRRETRFLSHRLTFVLHRSGSLVIAAVLGADRRANCPKADPEPPQCWDEFHRRSCGRLRAVGVTVMQATEVRDRTHALPDDGSLAGASGGRSPAGRRRARSARRRSRGIAPPRTGGRAGGTAAGARIAGARPAVGGGRGSRPPARCGGPGRHGVAATSRSGNPGRFLGRTGPVNARRRSRPAYPRMATHGMEKRASCARALARLSTRLLETL